MKSILIVLTILLLSPQLAFAAGGEAPALSSLIWPACNFAIFSFLLYRIYKKNVAGLLKSRAVSVKNHLGKAKKELVEAEENYQNLYDRLNNIESEKRELFARYDTEGAKLSKLILESANESSKRIDADSKRQVDSELNQTTKSLKQIAVKKAIALAEEKLRTGLTAEQDQKLRADALGCLMEESVLGRQASSREGA